MYVKKKKLHYIPFMHQSCIKSPPDYNGILFPTTVIRENSAVYSANPEIPS